MQREKHAAEPFDSELWAVSVFRASLSSSLILLLYDPVIASLDLNTQNVPERDLLPADMQPATWTPDLFLILTTLIF